MSGYLSRIVQSASRSSGLRPLAGSVFGKPAEDPHPSRLSDGPFTVDSEVPAWPAGTSTTQCNATGNPSSLATPADLQNYQPLQPRQASLTPFETLIAASNEPPQAAGLTPAQRSSQSVEIHPGRVRAADLSKDRQTFAKQIASRAEMVPQQPTSRSAQSGPLTREQENHRPDPDERDLRAPSISSNQTQIFPPQARIPAQPAQKQVATRLQQPAFRDRQTEPAQEPSIEIHIGRIEVLAVQPPAPAVPAPRRDRSTSLADYLAGRNGGRG